MTDLINKPGFTNRQKKTERSIVIEPTNIASDPRTFPDDPIIPREEKPKVERTVQRKVVKSNDLPKSIRISLADHVAISTIAMVEDKKIYEVISSMLDLYLETLPPSQQKLVKSSIQATIK